MKNKTPDPPSPSRDRKLGGTTLIDACASISTAVNAGLRCTFAPITGLAQDSKAGSGAWHKGLPAAPRSLQSHAPRPLSEMPAVSVLILFTVALYVCDCSV